MKKSFLILILLIIGLLTVSSVSAVDNLTDEERKNNGIENKNTLEIYDQLVIKEE